MAIQTSGTRFISLLCWLFCCLLSGCSTPETQTTTFDVPSLIGKDLDAVIKQLGEPQYNWEPTSKDLQDGAKTWDKQWRNKESSIFLLAEYRIADRQILNFFVFTKESAHGTNNRESLLQAANVKEQSSSYRVEFVSGKDEPQLFTGVLVVPSQSLVIEKIMVNPMQGKIWTDGSMRAVVEYCPPKSVNRPVIWKEWVMVRVFIQRTSFDWQKVPVWHGGLIKTTDSKGKVIPSACVSSGPIELDGKGQIRNSEEQSPPTSIQHYELQFELSLPRNYVTKDAITFQSRIADNTGLVVPISVEIPHK